jgi:hypothetical protein
MLPNPSKTDEQNEQDKQHCHGKCLPTADSVNSPNLQTGELRLIAQKLPAVASTALPAKTKPAELREILLAREALERSLKKCSYVPVLAPSSPASWTARLKSVDTREVAPQICTPPSTG